MGKFILWLSILLLTVCGDATEPGNMKNTLHPAGPIQLWVGEIPGALGHDPVRDIPTITPFWPNPMQATGAAVVVCPGGAYGALATNKEGNDYARWFNRYGIAAFVLKYRLGTNGYHHPAMMNDVLRAIRLVRYQASEWQLDPGRIAVIGSSAGGHLAATAVTHFDYGNPQAADPVERVSSRPDLGILCYPVITMGTYTHELTRKNLLGENPSPELIVQTSNELHVKSDTPPCFIWHTYGDPLVNVRNSMEFANAFLKKERPFELHIYQHGVHGWGLGYQNFDSEKPDFIRLHPWTNDLRCWLKRNKFIQMDHR